MALYKVYSCPDASRFVPFDVMNITPGGLAEHAASAENGNHARFTQTYQFQFSTAGV